MKKFRDPETGEVFEDIKRALRDFCNGYSLEQCFAHGCPFDSKASGNGGCIKWAEKNPIEAARLMGYEVIYEKEDDMDKQDKPLSEWTLGEIQALCEKRNGDGCCDDCPFANVIGNCTLRVLPEEWDLKEAPSLTNPEISIMRAVGAKWVSRDKPMDWVNLWSQEPVNKYDSDVYIWAPGAKSGYIGEVQASLFPSVKPGECIELEGAEG